MMDKNWLQLSDYSTKFGVSVSTLRRRIKSGEVEFEFDQGKYWLKDQPMARYVRHRPQATARKPVTEVQPVSPATVHPAQQIVADGVSNSKVKASIDNLQEFTASAQSMMSEIKSAFIKALHEKEQQIMELKQEVTDLKTLNKIMDQENERLKQSSYPEWIESPSAEA